MSAVLTNLRPYPIMATIGDAPIDVLRFDAHHAVNVPVATGSITIPLPVPSRFGGGDPEALLNKPISIQVGYRESVLRTVFNGYIRADRMQLSRNGHYATFMLGGYGRLLAWPESQDLRYPAMTPLDEIARSILVRRGVPRFRVDRVLAPDGTRIRLGGNPNIDDGEVIIPAGQDPLTWLNRVLGLFGYRAFDAPTEFRVQRVSGSPTIAPMETYREGLLAHQLVRDRDLDKVVTAWTVEGATYTDDDGVQIPVRSYPAGPIPPEPLLNPPGYREGTLRDNILVRDDLAHIARQIKEIDEAAVAPQWTINARGNSFFYPGGTIRVGSSNMEAAEQNMWVMSVRQSLDDRQGYKMVLNAWRGGGIALPNADDLQTINVQTGPVHLGDEHIPWYAVPNPTGKELSIPFTVPDVFTSIAISGYGHGCNSYLLDGNTDATVSMIEVWQNGEKVGSTQLPVMAENYEQRLPYGSGLTHWESFRMPVPGRLEPGSAEIKIISGEDNRLPAHTRFDDFEVRNLVLELRGAGSPELPTQGGA